MQTPHYRSIRPALALALTIVFLAALSCGTANEPDPAMAPRAAAGGTVESHAMSEHRNDGQTGQAMPSHTPADAVVIDLPIADRGTSLTRDDLRVSQGDMVRLVIEADEEGEVHLHGYNLTASVSPGYPGELVFEAATAGAFALNFHVFAAENNKAAGDHHGAEAPETVVSETPLSVAIIAEPDAHGGVDVQIVAGGFRFAPELVDQAHTPGAGHAHIYADGVRLARVFENEYHIEKLTPGEHEIRVSLNTNDHSDLMYGGKNVEATATVTVPDVGQGHGDGQDQQSADGDGHGHSHGAPSEREVVAEVHLGNLEVFP